MKKTAMKKNVTVLIVLLLTGLFMLPAYSSAQDCDGKGPMGPMGDKGFGPGEGPGGRHGHHGRHFSILGIWQNPEAVKDLGLTDAQVAKLKEADFAACEKAIELRSKMDGYDLQLDKEFSAAAVNEANVRAVAKKMAEVRGEMFMLRIEDRLTVKNILTAEQIEKLKSGMKDRRAERKSKGFDKPRRGGRDKGDNM